MADEHSVADLCSLILRHLIKALILLKVALTGSSLLILCFSSSPCFPPLVDRLTVRLFLHVEEGPAGETWLESEALQFLCGVDQSDLSGEFLEDGSDN